MRSNIVKIIIAVVMVCVLMAGAFSGGVLVGWIVPDRVKALASAPTLAPMMPGNPSEDPSPEASPTPTLPEQNLEKNNNNGPQADTPGDVQALFEPFWEAWQIVHNQYVDQPVDDTVLMRGAIRGMLGALGDAHTSFMDPDQYTQANIDMGGEYEGIGAWVDPTGDYLSIITPMPDSPAENAGLKPGDRIIAVDGDDMTGIDGNLVIQRVMGPAGSKVILTIQREGQEEPFDVELIRQKIVIPNTESRMLEGNIAYVRLYTFGDKSTADLRKALKDVMAQNPKGLIFDLRNNGGGYLITAIEVASEFVGEGTVMYEEYGDGKRDTYEAIPGGLATRIPLVVLVNQGTASASEIVAGAIQDYGRGQLVGETTFGKGSVQNWLELKDDQGAVRVTIARWLTPKERQIHEIGLKPDVEVIISDEDIQNERDPQLEKAIEILNK